MGSQNTVYSVDVGAKYEGVHGQRLTECVQVPNTAHQPNPYPRSLTSIQNTFKSVLPKILGSRSHSMVFLQHFSPNTPHPEKL